MVTHIVQTKTVKQDFPITFQLEEILKCPIHHVDGNVIWYKVPFYPGIVGICGKQH